MDGVYFRPPRLNLFSEEADDQSRTGVIVRHIQGVAHFWSYPEMEKLTFEQANERMEGRMTRERTQDQ